MFFSQPRLKLSYTHTWTKLLVPQWYTTVYFVSASSDQDHPQELGGPAKKKKKRKKLQNHTLVPER